LKTKTLGDLIYELTKLQNEHKGDYTVMVTRDSDSFFAESIDSWRGSYSKLAIGYSSYAEDSVTLDEFLCKLVDAAGEYFQGYKGGSYLMTTSTSVWCDNYGCYTCYAIKDITIDTVTNIITLVCREEEN